MADRWHLIREDGALTLCRHLPPRFDVGASAALPPGDPLRLAHQVRQDLWRMLRRVRGFSPVVRLTAQTDGWRVEAGGRAPRVPGTEARIVALLNDPRYRARWIRCASGRIA